MKKAKKVIALTMCAVMLVVGSVAGTMAYLTDDDAVTNTFTVGKVTLGNGTLEKGLDEALVNEYGEPVDAKGTKVDLVKAPRIQENDYKLVPGHEYTKDPTVHVKNDSESSYIFVKVDNGIANIEAATENTTDGYKNITDQILENDWVQLKDAQDNAVANVYWQKWNKPTTIAANNPTDDLIVFSEFKIDGDKVVNVAQGETVPNGKLDIADYANAKIVVTAYAIQADGFNSALEAWNAGSFQ